MQRKTIYDREWLEHFHREWLAEQEADICGKITEVTIYGGRLPETTPGLTDGVLQISYVPN